MRKYVVITRSQDKSSDVEKQLSQLHLAPFYCVSIEFRKNLSQKKLTQYLSNLSSYDWIIFTSARGVDYFFQLIKELKSDDSALHDISIAAIGEKTAQKIRLYGKSVTVLPSHFSTKDLLNEFPDISGAKILLPRSNIADPHFKIQLEKKGAKVTDMPIYKTEPAKVDTGLFLKRFQISEILCITFTSPSTIEGLLKNFDSGIISEIVTLPVVCIGPKTSQAAQENGFQEVYTAQTHTMEGIVTKIKEVFYN